MKAIRQKLKSERGASVVFALVTFMVAAVICAGIVNTAITNTYRIRNGRQQEQANLTVQSAAQLMKNAILGDEIQIQTLTVSCQEDGTKELKDFSMAYLESDEKENLRDNPYADLLLSYGELLWKDITLAEGQEEQFPLGQKILKLQTEDFSHQVLIESFFRRFNTVGSDSDVYEVTMHMELDNERPTDANCLVTLVFSAVLEAEEPQTESRQVSLHPMRTETTEKQISHLKFTIKEARQGK